MTPIFTYTDYRQFLKDKYQELKSSQSSFSYRYFSQHAGFSSPNFLKLVMDGKRNLSSDSIHRFAYVLKLNAKEQRFFELLVNYSQATDSKQKQHYYQQLLAFPEYRKVHHLEKEHYHYLSHWYYPAVLELVNVASFREDPEWISEVLQKNISAKEAREAIDCLLALGLLNRNSKGKLETVHQSLTTGDDARALAAHSFHEQILELAKKAITQQESDEREFAAITLSVNELQLRKIKELIRDFRKSVLNTLSAESEAPTAVYQFAVQLFSLTILNKGGEKKGPL